MFDSEEPVADTNDTDVSLDQFEAEFYGKEATEPEPEPEGTEGDDEDPDLDGGEADDDDSQEDDLDGDGDTDTDDENGEDDDPEPDPEPEPKRNRKTAKERIQELVHERNADRAEYQRRIAEIEARLAKAETPKDEPKAEPKVEVAAEAPDPDALDKDGNLVYPLGEFDPQYIADLSKHDFDRRWAAKMAEQEQAQQAQARAAEEEKLTASWQEKLSTTEKELPDLREKLGNLETTFQTLDPAYGTYLAQTIMSLDHGPEVLYYLSQNIDEAKKIVASGSVAATLALGRLEGQLTKKAEAPKPPKKVTKAPAAVPPASRGTGAGSKVVRADTEDLDAFEREFYRKK